MTLKPGQLLLILVSILTLMVLVLPSSVSGSEIVFSDYADWQNMQMDRNAVLVPGIDGTADVAITESIMNIDSESADLIIQFEGQNNQAWTESIGNYAVVQQNFLFSTETKVAGTSSARFFRPNDKLILRPLTGSWIQETHNAGSFTVEFWMNPHTGFDNQTIFRKSGPVITSQGAEIECGIIAYIRENRVVFEFKNFFCSAQSRLSQTSTRQIVTDTISLASNSIISANRWTHVALTYNESTGMLKVYINGVEDSWNYATSNRMRNGEMLIPAFNRNERSNLIIGENYWGYLDNFAIHRYSKDAFFLNPYIERSGVLSTLIVSDVIDLEHSFSQIQLLDVNYTRPEGTRVIVEYRCGNDIFSRDLSAEYLAWREVNLNTSEILFENTGRYFQFRINLIASSDGLRTPVLHDVSLIYTEDSNPDPPMHVYAYSRNNRVIITYQGSPDDDVVGYKIYFGPSSGDYVSFEDSPLTISLSEIHDPGNPYIILDSLTVHEVYYISITAFDQAGNESDYSNEVVVEVIPFP